ncbi:pleiotropic drug resistance protein 3-like [Telopea speciosissima]|uniref:pleiotropic drug resistance protein 3-like n=1 Tax=Telopea speciosissima TaxID=54955 RepID=UPI001CC3BAE5|nr:pleiotropic drug resistance protein 3-like [Telopea speciosissima]
MAQFTGDDDEIESLRIELTEIARSMRRSFQSFRSNGRTSSAMGDLDDHYNDSDVGAAAVEYYEQWAAIERLPTYERTRLSLFDNYDDDDDDHDQKGSGDGKRVVDVRKLKAPERRVFISKLIKNVENDNLRLLQKLRDRIDRVAVKLPTVEVRYKNLSVEAECEVVHGKPLPTLWNSFRSTVNCSSISYIFGLFIGQDFTKLFGSKSQIAKISILKDVRGVIKPSR